MPAVRKAHILGPSPFAGGTALATVVGDRVIRHGQVRRRSPLPLPHEGFRQFRVDVVNASVGARADQIPDAIRRGAHGVVMTTRATHGPVVPIYGDGGGVDLVRAGAKPAGMLSPAQARVLLMLLISQGLTGPELHSTFTSSTF